MTTEPRCPDGPRSALAEIAMPGYLSPARTPSDPAGVDAGLHPTSRLGRNQGRTGPTVA
jgi:hypothetical protein